MNINARTQQRWTLAAATPGQSSFGATAKISNCWNDSTGRTVPYAVSHLRNKPFVLHSKCSFLQQWAPKPLFLLPTAVEVSELLPVAPVKTSPCAGLSEMMAVASTVDALSKVSAPEVVICPAGVTVTGNIKALSQLTLSTQDMPVQLLISLCCTIEAQGNSQITSLGQPSLDHTCNQCSWKWE